MTRTKIEIYLFLTRQDVYADEHVNTFSELTKCPWMFVITLSVWVRQCRTYTHKIKTKNNSNI